MPLLITLKEPHLNLIVDGEIKDNDEEYWDKIFDNGCLLVKNRTGQNVVVPIWKESNIAIIQEVTKEQVEEQAKRAKERGQENTIVTPQYAFPGSKRPPGGGGVKL